MELRHLRYFVAVAEELNFTRAAHRLHISQPQLSQQIRQFEEEIGVRLLDRTRRRVVLTQAGQAVLGEARNTLAQANRIPAVAHRTAQGLGGTLRVGFSSAAAHTVLPGVVRSFRSKVPEVNLQLLEMSTERQIARLCEASIDIGFVRLPLESPPASLEVRSIFREPLILAIPRGHALSRSRRIPTGVLAKAPFIRFPRHVAPGLYDQIEGIYGSAGFKPNVVREALEIQTMISLVAAGLGVAIVPESARNIGSRQIVYRPLPQRETTEMGVAYERANRSGALRLLLSIVKPA
jgi:DNA-binding transcriptional LysR family regulator